MSATSTSCSGKAGVAVVFYVCSQNLLFGTDYKPGLRGLAVRI
jgi:hypothetical protein